MADDNIFSGLKVVDFASFIAGPGAATILSDFGADVIKVEPPNGDTWRIGHKIPPQPQADDAYQWHLANRNKRGMTLDLKSPQGHAAFMRLVEKADVVVENFRPDVKERMGIAYEALSAVNPRIILASISGFGQSGPYRMRAGFDQIAQGTGGLM